MLMQETGLENVFIAYFGAFFVKRYAAQHYQPQIVTGLNNEYCLILVKIIWGKLPYCDT